MSEELKSKSRRWDIRRRELLHQMVLNRENLTHEQVKPRPRAVIPIGVRYIKRISVPPVM